MKKRKRHFTLMEVVIGTAILSVALVASLRLSMQSVLHAVEGIRYWENVHMLTQAAEYALVVGPDQMSSLNRDIFYHDDYNVNYNIVATDNPPSTQKIEEMGNAKRELQTIRIQVHNRYDNSEQMLDIDQLVYTGQGDES